MRSVVFLAALLVVGCASQLIDPNKRLSESEGLVLLNVECAHVVKWIHILSSGRKSGFLTDYSPDRQLLCGEAFGNDRDGIMLIALKEGDYFFGTVGYTTSLNIEESDAYKFSIKPGMLNYIGDLKVSYQGQTLRPNRTVSYVSVTVEDNMDSALSHIKESYPDILEKFSVNRAVARK